MNETKQVNSDNYDDFSNPSMKIDENVSNLVDKHSGSKDEVILQRDNNTMNANFSPSTCSMPKLHPPGKESQKDFSNDESQ